VKLIDAAEAAWLPDQPCKEFRLHRNDQCDHAADSQTNDRASSYSAPKHLLFAVCHFTPPKATATLPQPQGQAVTVPESSYAISTSSFRRERFLKSAYVLKLCRTPDQRPGGHRDSISACQAVGADKSKSRELTSGGGLAPRPRQTATASQIDLSLGLTTSEFSCKRRPQTR
jgi:hypothetical protein